MDENAPDLLTLEDEDGVQHTFDILDELYDGDLHYYAVVPEIRTKEEADEALARDDDLLVMKAVSENGEDFLDIITDEAELKKIGDLFAERLGDLYDITGSDEKGPQA